MSTPPPHGSAYQVTPHWWIASDGFWYPPELHPDYQPPPPPAPPRSAAQVPAPAATAASAQAPQAAAPTPSATVQPSDPAVAAQPPVSQVEPSAQAGSATAGFMSEVHEAASAGAAAIGGAGESLADSAVRAASAVSKGVAGGVENVDAANLSVKSTSGAVSEVAAASVDEVVGRTGMGSTAGAPQAAAGSGGVERDVIAKAAAPVAEASRGPAAVDEMPKFSPAKNREAARQASVKHELTREPLIKAPNFDRVRSPFAGLLALGGGACAILGSLSQWGKSWVETADTKILRDNISGFEASGYYSLGAGIALVIAGLLFWAGAKRQRLWGLLASLAGLVAIGAAAYSFYDIRDLVNRIGEALVGDPRLIGPSRARTEFKVGILLAAIGGVLGLIAGPFSRKLKKDVRR